MPSPVYLNGERSELPEKMPCPVRIEGVSPVFVEALQHLVNAHLAEVTALSELASGTGSRQEPFDKSSATSSPEKDTTSSLFQMVAAPASPPKNDQPKNDVCLAAAESGLEMASVLSQSQQHLIDVFKALDTDGSGTLTSTELRKVLGLIGLPNARIVKLLRMADRDRSGEVEMSEWKAVVARSDFDEFLDVTVNIDEVLPRLKKQEELDEKPPDNRIYIILPTSSFRLVWDFFVMLSCIFIAVEFPFIYAWEDDMSERTLNMCRVPEYAVDGVLVLDIILNFFTGFYDERGRLVLEHRGIAKHYLKNWFLIDLCSSIPFEVFTGSWNVQMLKVLKFWKVLRFFKMLKIGSLEFSDLLADVALSKVAHTVQRRSNLLLYMLLACHWMACGMKLVDQGFLRGFEYSGAIDDRVSNEYLVAWYWAMTTLTTVGYGDITPDTNAEIGFVIFAMVLGGSFYGYVVGTISSMVASTDLNATAYYERMEIVHAWLAHHGLPQEMKRRLRRYFKALMEQHSAANESDLWHDLTQELQIECSEYIIRDTVKSNPLFDRLGLGAVVQLQSVVKHVTMDPPQRVTTAGEVGTAMYMIETGLLQWTHSFDNKSGSMGPGESFGEEILLGFREDYDYTVEVVKQAQLEVIEESDFLAAFQCMPRVVEKMRRNALSLAPEWEETELSRRPSKNDLSECSPQRERKKVENKTESASKQRMNQKGRLS